MSQFTAPAPPPTNAPAQLGWVLYDARCGFCRWWIPHWERLLNSRGFAIAPLQSEWVAERFQLSAAELVDDLRLLWWDGSSAQGADVYRAVLKRIWWAWPLYTFAVLPGTRLLFNWGYRWFARNRFRVSAACQLPSN